MRKLHNVFFCLGIIAILLAWHWHLVVSDDGYMYLLAACGWFYWLFVASRQKQELARESLY